MVLGLRWSHLLLPHLQGDVALGSAPPAPGRPSPGSSETSPVPPSSLPDRSRSWVPPLPPRTVPGARDGMTGARRRGSVAGSRGWGGVPPPGSKQGEGSARAADTGPRDPPCRRRASAWQWTAKAGSQSCAPGCWGSGVTGPGSRIWGLCRLPPSGGGPSEGLSVCSPVEEEPGRNWPGGHGSGERGWGMGLSLIHI